MDAVFLILAGLIAGGAIAAITLRNLVHCALALVVAFGGLAMVYLRLSAAFIGFTQVLVYVGAVAILIVFAILLTRSDERAAPGRFGASWVYGVLGAAAVFGFLACAILGSGLWSSGVPTIPEASVRGIGELLMTRYVLPLQVIGLLLTVALIGAVILAMHPGRNRSEGEDEQP